LAVEIVQATELASGEFAPIIAESESEGWRFLRRLVDDWTRGANRFDRPGEALFVARNDGCVVGVCGLNLDPYTSDEATGRVRRLYVLQSHRGKGIGQRLVKTVIAAATGRFRRLRVRTENAEAARLYERLGFEPVEGDGECTHILELEDCSLNSPSPCDLH
jgi:GNAT superfamily N-acetyltransferase